MIAKTIGILSENAAKSKLRPDYGHGENTPQPQANYSMYGNQTSYAKEKNKYMCLACHIDLFRSDCIELTFIYMVDKLIAVIP